uniref:Protein kinase domain-containing protein n=1 Tax=Nelumbo nucifera TaxID=4432 RepID=A0A822Y657_NELNU|nr:TPA_asm: hypothetical protein HUJ06_030942 [Nelumbo nucifera]
MHFAASPPIFHRDIKSTNILLDDNYTAKVSDFGASRLVPLDQTQFTTLVQGTMGYLDPEYFHTSRLTEKSDVYSFGIVLAELLTGRKALEFDRPEKEKSLALHFISSMKEENILDILEDRVLYEANEDQLREVAKLVERSLSVKGEERPTMKEVAMELEGLRRSSKHLWDEPHEEVECLLGDPPNSQNFNTTNYDSLGNQVVISLDCGR